MDWIIDYNYINLCNYFGETFKNNFLNINFMKSDEIRKKLSAIDLSYDDCYTILLGHIKYEADKRLNNIPSQKERKNDNQSNG